MKNFAIRSSAREEMIDITAEVAGLVSDLETESGVCTLFSAHTTCGLTINENADPDVRHDILLFLRDLVPQYFEGFRHFEHNSDAHIKSSLMGSSVSVLFENRELLLGRWQGIYLCEFDGPKTRTVICTIS